MIADPASYWSEAASPRPCTPGGAAWPEGEDFPAWIGARVGSDGRLVDFGCGIGRLAGGFAPGRYLGLDISPMAVAAARAAWPDHRFETMLPGEVVPEAEVALCHTVLLHVDDVALAATVASLAACRRVVVCEILGRRWRRDGLPPVFNREVEDYQAAFAPRPLVAVAERHYPRYGGAVLSALTFGPSPDAP